MTNQSKSFFTNLSSILLKISTITRARRGHASRGHARHSQIASSAFIALCALAICHLPAFAAAEVPNASENVPSSTRVSAASKDENTKSSSTNAKNAQCEAEDAPRDDESKDGSKDEAAGWSYGGEIDFNSRYLWRGIVLSRGAVAQPSAWVSSRDYTLSVWGNIELGRSGSDDLQDGGRRFNEVDVRLSRTFEREKWTVEPAFEMYLYPRASDGDSTGEVSLRVSRGVGKMTAYGEFALDVVRYKGATYAEIGLSREHTFNPRASGEAAFELGFGSSRFNRVNLDAEGGGLNFATLDLSLSYILNQNFTLRPHATLSTLLPQRLRRQVDDATVFVLGLALESEF